MTKLEALKALAEKVEAGEWDHSPSGCSRVVFPYRSASIDDLGLTASGAFNGSLDAAKELHEAVLHERVFVEIEWSKRYEEESRVTLNMGKYGWVSSSDTLARAWLLSILKALIAQEEAA